MLPKTNHDLCPNCQRPLDVDASCKHCLFQLGKSGPTPQVTEDLPTPAELACSFPQLEITRLVGRGGMGAIYHARQRALGRDVALKIISRNVASDPAFEERFRREAQTLARLSHPHIVTVYDFGTTDDGLVYLLMEFVDGVNLREAMDADSIRPREAIQIISEMCAALQFAHDRGVVHRDIKPENVLINEDGVVKVADFGLAKLLGDSPTNLTLTQTRQVMGTLRYMSPEQMDNPTAVDHRADIYSLGVVFYELLTGQIPHGRFDSPSHVKPDVNPLLDDIVMRTLDRKPPNRFQRASDIASQLSQLQESATDSVASTDSAAKPAIAGLAAGHSPIISIPFEADALGSFAVAVGSVTLDHDWLDVSYRTRDSILGIVKSAPKSVRIPLHELSRLEWLPGIFGSKLAVVPKTHGFAEELPNADNGRALLKIPFAESRSAARLVHLAAKRYPPLAGSNASNSFIQDVAESGLAHTVSRSRVTLGILFLCCAVSNIVALVLLLIFLSHYTQHTAAIVAIVFAPILAVASAGCQLVGGIFCFSPYTRRMPLAAATVSMLPLTITWPISLCVGLWAWLVLGSADMGQHPHERFLTRQQLASGRIGTTLQFLRESRWTRIAALANIALATIFCSLLVAYRCGLYPQTLHFRTTSDPVGWSEEQDVIRSRLQDVSGIFNIGFQDGKFSSDRRTQITSMKYAQADIFQALAVTGKVRWAWAIRSASASATEPAGRVRLAGKITHPAIEPQGQWIELASEAREFHIEDIKSISEVPSRRSLSAKNSLQLLWTPAGRAALEDSRPSQATGLVLMVEELIEGFAPLDDIQARGVTFLMAADSKVEPAAIEAAIRGPALSQPLELLDR